MERTVAGAVIAAPNGSRVAGRIEISAEFNMTAVAARQKANRCLLMKYLGVWLTLANLAGQIPHYQQINLGAKKEVQPNPSDVGSRYIYIVLVCFDALHNFPSCTVG